MKHLLILLGVVVLGALTGIAAVRYLTASQSPQENWMVTVKRLEPIARAAVEHEYGPFKLTVVEAKPLQDFYDPHVESRVLQDTLFVAASDAQNERACYKTLCRYMIVAAVGPFRADAKAPVDIGHLQWAASVAVNEARAEELTAKQFGTRPKYNFTTVPDCDVKPSLLIDLVKHSRPEAELLVTDAEHAKTYLQTCKQLPTYLW